MTRTVVRPGGPAVTANDLAVLDLLDALVRIDSVNPGLSATAQARRDRCLRRATGGEQPACASRSSRAPPVGPASSSAAAATTGGRRLLLCGHLDTVGLGRHRDALTPRIEGDRLYARGAYDMKAGLAAALIACRDAALAGIDGEVIVAAVADEELASLGIQEVLATSTRPASTPPSSPSRPNGRRHRPPRLRLDRGHRHRRRRPRITPAPRRRRHPGRRPHLVAFASSTNSCAPGRIPSSAPATCTPP